PLAQRSFLEHGGIETIIKIVDQADSNNKMKLRAIQLMNDLIIEKDQAMDDKRLVYENLREILTGEGRKEDRLSDVEFTQMLEGAPLDPKGNLDYGAFTRQIKRGKEDE
ncbi:unnamed protein product, partial [Rotaria magnacalcarata]